MQNLRVQVERFLLRPVHPFLFSIFFVFRVYTGNISDIPFVDFLRPLFISVLATAVFYLVFLRLVRVPHTAASMTSVLVLAFYLYGLGWECFPMSKTQVHAVVFASLWALATVLLIFLLGWKMRTQPSPDIVAGINLTALILLLFPTVELSIVATARQFVPEPKVHHVIQNTLSSPSPDIYYIILDSYGRADVLKDTYGYDNDPFLQSLKDLGFYVAVCSQSNYASTGPSLTSSLNLDYLQTLSDTFEPDIREYLNLFTFLDKNAVQESVSNMGYKTISFASGFPWAEWRDADVFLAPPNGPMSEFETLLLHLSYARILDDTWIINFDDKYAERFRTRTWLVLNSFDMLAATPGPKFVFIHLMVPHSPFAFDENGNPIAPELADPKYGYLDQVKFINKFLLPRLTTLVTKSETPPVIIIQGDHGPLLPDNQPAEMKILNAYYLPRGREMLYPTISPVNSFRVVFNSLFDASLPLLEDVSYYSDRATPYDFSVLAHSCSN